MTGDYDEDDDCLDAAQRDLFNRGIRWLYFDDPNYLAVRAEWDEDDLYEQACGLQRQELNLRLLSFATLLLLVLASVFFIRT